MQQTKSQQCSVLKIIEPDKDINASPSKNNANNTFSGEKKIEHSIKHIHFRSSVFNDSSELAMNFLNCNKLNQQHNERINFVRMCIQKIDRYRLPTNFDQWTVENQHEHLTNNVDKYFPNIPSSLRYVLPAVFKNGDCERPASARPDWLDMDKFHRGQKFAQDNFTSVCVAQILSLFFIFSFEDGLKTLILSRKSDTPYLAFKRYLSTLMRINHWYMEDPWDQKTQAHRDIQKVRKMHSTMRQRLCNYDNQQIDAKSRISHVYSPMWEMLQKDFRDACPAVKDLQCPFTMVRTRSINQGDMSCTQGGFISLTVLYPEKFGIYVCDEDLDAYCHMWRGLGYLLGIEDHYNFCCGNLQEVRERVKDVIEQWVKPNLRSVTPEWEHMSMCLHKGLYLPMALYKVHLFYFCDVLDLKMPRLYGTINLVENTLYVWINFFMGYLMRLPAIRHFINALTHWYLHLVTKF